MKKPYNKYGVAPKEKRTLDGVTYASKKEKDFRAKLNLLKNAAKQEDRIIEITEQLTFTLSVNDILICKYRLDFLVKYANGSAKYFDVKGMKSGAAYTTFQHKQRLMKACYGIDVIEV